jgi:hypothetical protein
MALFELESWAKAKLLDLIVLSQKNRQPDEDPGAKLSVEITLTNDALAYFDGSLKSMLFCKLPKGLAPQAELDGIEAASDKPNLTAIGQKVGALHWEQELTGYGLVIDYGTGGKRNIEIEDCAISNFRLHPKEGGTVLIKCDIESANVTETQFGKLAKLKSRDMQITLTPPEPVQDEIDEPATPKRRRGRGGDEQHVAH